MGKCSTLYAEHKHGIVRFTWKKKLEKYYEERPQRKCALLYAPWPRVGEKITEVLQVFFSNHKKHGHV